MAFGITQSTGFWPERTHALVGSAIWGVALFAGCSGPVDSGSSPQANQGAPSVQTGHVTKQDLARRIELPGTVEGYETADLYAKVGGYLESIAVDIGDRITKGDALAKLSIPEMQSELERKEALVDRALAQVDQAKAAIRQAAAEATTAEAAVSEAGTERSQNEAERELRETQFQRVQRLVEEGSAIADLEDEAKFQLAMAEAALGTVAARIRTAEAKLMVAKAKIDKENADYNSALAQVEVARADYAHTKTILQYATLRAPFDGVVTRRFVHPGAFIPPAEGNSAARPVLTVTRTDRVRISVSLPMREAGLLKNGARAVLDRIDALPGKRFEGQVSRSSPSLDTGSRMMRVEVDLDNPDDLLLPGYYGTLSLDLKEFPDTPMIPTSALLVAEGAEFVFVVENGVCKKTQVTTNYQDGETVGIASGLEGGEQIILTGGGQLSDGQKVTPILAQAETSNP